MHYAVPKILHDAGLLHYFYTDICAIKGWPRALRIIPPFIRPAPLRRLLARQPSAVPQEKIVAFNNFGLEYFWKLRRAHTASKVTQIYLWAGDKINDLALSCWNHDTKVVYGYNSACEKLFQSLCRDGVIRIMEQTIAPIASEAAILSSEQEWAFESFEKSYDDFQEQLIEREKHEWQLAEHIVCGSEFVRDEVIAQGGSPNKCFVVPYGVQSPPSPYLRDTPNKYDTLRILFVGSICVRKGLRYLFEAMQKLRGRNVKCRVVGPISLPQNVLRRYVPSNVEIVGPVPRSEIAREYRAANVFCLPSLCEGSATVIYEALAAGLPVVTTPNAGSIIRDGIEGFIVPIKNSEILAEKLKYLDENRHLVFEMGQRATQRSYFGSLDAYAQRLTSFIASVTKYTNFNFPIGFASPAQQA